MLKICALLSLLQLHNASSFSPTARIDRSTMRFASEPDLFDYFDPLLSPHAYPNGISPDNNKPAPKPKKRPFGLQLESVITTKDERPMVDTSVVFDPTISPHAYSQGTPDTVIGDTGTVYVEPKLVGILLMDHGSKNEASNMRLHKLVDLYQSMIPESNVIVKGAHMEIASPSIPDQLQALVELGVDEIICHPYFLSPGRHVRQDIPHIVETAIEELKIEIPVITTDPVGANTDIMLQAVNMAVRESSQFLKSK